MAERIESNANPYLTLGVRPFINCCSVRTMHGGSLMLPRVRAAVAEASRYFVNLDELMEAAGRRLAELTGAEWGLVTCGSAAAVALGTAACVAGNDPIKMLRLPFTEGMVNRVIIPRSQRFAYDQAVRMIGCGIVQRFRGRLHQIQIRHLDTSTRQFARRLTGRRCSTLAEAA